MTDEITRLRAENGRLREALRPFAQIKVLLPSEDKTTGYCVSWTPFRDYADFTSADLARARAAMGEE